MSTQIIWQCYSVKCNRNMRDMNQHLWSQCVCWPFSGFEHSEAKQLLYPGSMYIWHLVHHGILKRKHKRQKSVCIDSVCMRGKMYAFHRWPHVSPHLPMRNRWPHSQHPTTANQTPQIFCCSFQSRVSGRSAACAEGEEDGTGLGGAFSGTLMNQNKLLCARYQTAWEKKPMSISSCRNLILNPRCHLLTDLVPHKNAFVITYNTKAGCKLRII